jgi:hypothetical protein
MPAFHKKALEASLKRAGVAKTATYVLNRKNIGDFLLKYGLRAVLVNSLYHGKRLCRKKVTFTKTALVRKMCWILQTADEGWYSALWPLCTGLAVSGLKIKELLDVARAMLLQPRPAVWRGRFVEWLGCKKIQLLLHYAAAHFDTELVRALVQQEGIVIGRCYEYWTRGVDSRKCTADAHATHRALWAYHEGTPRELMLAYCSVVRTDNVTLLRDMFFTHTTLGPEWSESCVVNTALRSTLCLRQLHAWGMIASRVQECMQNACYTNSVDAMLFLMEIKDYQINAQDVCACIRGHAAEGLHLLFCFSKTMREQPLSRVLAWAKLCARHCSTFCLGILVQHYPAVKTHPFLRELQGARAASPITGSQGHRVAFAALLQSLSQELPSPKLVTGHRSKEVRLLLGGKKPECTICFETICAETAHMLGCGHIFHNACLARCVQTNCPNCRTSFQLELV